MDHKVTKEDLIRHPYIWGDHNEFIEEDFVIVLCTKSDDEFEYSKHYPMIIRNGEPAIISFKDGKPKIITFKFNDIQTGIVPKTEQYQATFIIQSQLIYEYKNNIEYRKESEEGKTLNESVIVEMSKKKSGDYEIPRRCEKCNSEDFQLHVVYSGFIIVQLRCMACGEIKALRKIDSQARNRLSYDEAVRQSKWREAIINKFGNECYFCGSKEELHAHHILPYSQAGQRKFSINNGIPLCKKCHNELHNAYWKMYKNVEEYKEID